MLTFVLPDSTTQPMTTLPCLRGREETKRLDFKCHKAHIQNELPNCFSNLLRYTQFKFKHNWVLNHCVDYDEDKKKLISEPRFPITNCLIRFQIKSVNCGSYLLISKI